MDLVNVYYEGENGRELVAKDIVPVDGAVTFQAEHFSVYVVVEEIVPRLTVNFYNYDGTTLLETMYVKKADTEADVDKIIHDASPKVVLNKDNGEVFYGWTETQNYTTSAAENAMSIEDVRSAVTTKKDTLSNKDMTVNYYAVACRSYFIDYLDDKNITLGSHEVRMLMGAENQQSYTVNMTYTPADSVHNFEGWKVSEGKGNIEGYDPSANNGEGTYYLNGTEITISGNIVFSVNAPSGQWLIYDENAPSGSKATYNAPRFLKTGEVTVDPNTADRPMTCVGYEFGGWFDTKEHADNLNSQDGKFTFGSTINDRTVIYARWIPKTQADYVIVIWKQSVNGVDSNNNKLYDFEETIKVKNAAVGSSINAVTGTSGNRNATVNGTSKGWDGFHYQSNDQQGKTVAADGSTVINVYFDRNEHTLSFQVQGYIYTPTTSTSDWITQYGLVNGRYVELTRHNSGSWMNPNYYWTYGNNIRYNGTRYTRDNGWETIKEITAL